MYNLYTSMYRYCVNHHIQYLRAKKRWSHFTNPNARIILFTWNINLEIGILMGRLEY